MKAQPVGARKLAKVVITRSRKGNAELASRLEAIGLEPISVDTIEFLPPQDWSRVDASLRRLGEFDWVLLTSPTGAEFFAGRMKALSLAVPWSGRPEVAAVGEKTSAALQKEGIRVGFVPSEYLTKALAEQLPKGQGDRLLLLRADIGDLELAAALERRGFQVTDLTIYRTSPVAGAEDESTRPALRDADAIVFASPSAVEAFMKRFVPGAASSEMTRRLLAVCIGPVTAKAARDRGFERILSPKTHTIESLVRELGKAAAAGEGA
ncbi:MAG TPA: uroporphyrinogen-III synthase [Nitrososphaerales archaeon]|nr:uroporphyrinogen-III synthase [Nitrososphaerales archaeon]